MFGHHGWRPLTVALLVSGSVFLPQGIAAAAPPDKLDSATCAQLSAEARSNRADCTPARAADAAQPFIGPLPAAREPQGGDASPSSVAGFRFSGSATTGFTSSTPPAAPPTVAPAAVAPPAAGPATSNSSPSGTNASTSATTGPSASGPATGPANQATANQATANPVPADPAPPAVAPPAVAPPAVATAVPAPVVPNGTEWSTTGPSPWDDTPPTASATPGTSGSGTTGSSTTDPGSATRAESRPSDDSSDGSDSRKNRDSASGSARSGDDSDDSDSDKKSTSSGRGSTSDSSSGGYSGPTSADTTLGAASCPGTAGTGGEGPSSATGSVSTGAATVGPVNPNIPAAASVTDVTGNDAGTATRPSNQAFAGRAGSGSSVAGTVLDSASTSARAGGSASMPGDIINLASWYLTLPTGQQGSPDTIEAPTLERFANQFFKLNPTRDGVVFSADGAGVTTKNSHYPRSELREMNGSEKASWSNTSGSHTLDVCEAFTKLPSAKPEVVGVQIHDGKDDVMQIRLEGQKLMVQYNDGKSEALLDPNYQLGTPYNVRVTAADGKVDVLYNGRTRAELPLAGSGWYWKVGAYVQSNSTHGDGADSMGEVTVYSLKCVHQ